MLSFLRNVTAGSWPSSEAIWWAFNFAVTSLSETCFLGGLSSTWVCLAHTALLSTSATLYMPLWDSFFNCGGTLKNEIVFKSSRMSLSKGSRSILNSNSPSTNSLFAVGYFETTNCSCILPSVLKFLNVIFTENFSSSSSDGSEILPLSCECSVASSTATIFFLSERSVFIMSKVYLSFPGECLISLDDWLDPLSLSWECSASWCCKSSQMYSLTLECKSKSELPYVSSDG